MRQSVLPVRYGGPAAHRAPYGLVEELAHTVLDGWRLVEQTVHDQNCLLARRDPGLELLLGRLQLRAGLVTRLAVRCQFLGDVRRRGVLLLECGAQVALRWTAAGLLAAERRFHRIKGCKSMPVLMAALEACDAKRLAGQPEAA